MKLVIGLFVAFVCAGRLWAADQPVPIDASPQAVEAAYQAVRAGDAVPVTTLKQTAEVLLVKLINGAVATGEFLADQIPIVVKELLVWKTTYYAARVVFGIGLLVSAWTLLQYTIKKHRLWQDKSTRPANRYYDGEWWFLLFAIVPLTGLGIWHLSYFWWLLQITLAPRVWLIEYAASLVK